MKVTNQPKYPRVCSPPINKKAVRRWLLDLFLFSFFPFFSLMDKTSMESVTTTTTPENELGLVSWLFRESMTQNRLWLQSFRMLFLNRGDSLTVGTPSSEGSAATTMVRRGRGRPRGSKNRAKPVTETETKKSNHLTDPTVAPDTPLAEPAADPVASLLGEEAVPNPGAAAAAAEAPGDVVVVVEELTSLSPLVVADSVEEVGTLPPPAKSRSVAAVRRHRKRVLNTGPPSEDIISSFSRALPKRPRSKH